MPKENRIGFFEKYLSIWVLACIIFGVFLGNLFRQKIEIISDWNIYSINIPVAFLVWLMIYPMMVQIDFSSLKEVGKIGKELV